MIKWIKDRIKPLVELNSDKLPACFPLHYTPLSITGSKIILMSGNFDFLLLFIKKKTVMANRTDI